MGYLWKGVTSTEVFCGVSVSQSKYIHMDAVCPIAFFNDDHVYGSSKAYVCTYSNLVFTFCIQLVICKTTHHV